MEIVADLGNDLYVNPARRAEYERKLLTHGFSSEFGSQVRRKNGGSVWVSETARAVRFPAGILRYFEGTVENITVRREAQEALRRQNQYLEALYDTTLALMNRLELSDLLETLVQPSAYGCRQRQRILLRRTRKASRVTNSVVDREIIVKLLLIEDNELNRDMVSRRLQRLGYETLVAVDGQKGVELARLELPDLVIMDLSLPGIDGWEATRLLKADPATAGIRVIALTAHAVSSDREHAIAAGCDDCDTKPVDLQRLLVKIERLLGIAQHGPAIQAPPPPIKGEGPFVVAGKERDVTAAPAGPMPRLLIVEDNELNRDMLSRRLRRHGYDIAVALNGEQGVSIAQSERPDLILMDMSLPGLDGWEATRLLKAAPETRRIPIIALTAHAMTSDRDKAIAAGCDDYDTKPVEIRRLLGKIETWLGRSGVQLPD